MFSYQTQWYWCELKKFLPYLKYILQSHLPSFYLVVSTINTHMDNQLTNTHWNGHLQMLGWWLLQHRNQKENCIVFCWKLSENLVICEQVVHMSQMILIYYLFNILLARPRWPDFLTTFAAFNCYLVVSSQYLNVSGAEH